MKQSPSFPGYGLGIDAGGTYTDAVLFDFEQRSTLWKNKALTTPWDFSAGINNALEGLEPAIRSRISLVAVSTTLATNALVEGRGQRVGLLVMPASEGFDPGEIGHAPLGLIQGRVDIGGSVAREIDPEEIKIQAREMISRQEVKAFAVSGYAGCINPILELRVKEILHRQTGMSVTCGHELSFLLDFLVRARTAVLNARIIPEIERFISNLETVLQERGLSAPVFMVKGDGSLISLDTARERPVETILSGPAASLTGAAHLTGRKDAVMVDIGGTTTDIASLRAGRAVISPDGARLGSHQTHVRAIRIKTRGVGGDSLLELDQGRLRIGPRRVIPLAWLGTHCPGLHEALQRLEERLDPPRHTKGCTEILTFLSVKDPDWEMKPEEKEILKILKTRPHSLLELTEKTDGLNWRLLPLERLQADGLIQRAGLTPTDLLHSSGDFTRWDITAARRMTAFFARTVDLAPEALIEWVRKELTRTVALEILLTQIAPAGGDRDQQPCPLCWRLLHNAVHGGDGNANYRVRFNLTRPIIAIGAPAHIFLPEAGELLNTEVIVPEHAEVANAIGAITGSVRIERQIRIRPDNGNGFYLEGVPGRPVFQDLEEASARGTEYLTRELEKIGRLNRAGETKVRIDSTETSVKTGREKIFLSLTLTACLDSPPLNRIPSHDPAAGP